MSRAATRLGLALECFGLVLIPVTEWLGLTVFAIGMGLLFILLARSVFFD